jgi:hypothetical protein
MPASHRTSVASPTASDEEMMERSAMMIDATKRVLPIALAAVLAACCTDLPPLPDQPDASTADADSDSDTDSDTDADTDTDTDTDTETEDDTEDPRPPMTDCADGLGRYDSVSDLCWEEPPSDTTLNWYDAVDYCAELVLGGRDDWRMPMIQELISPREISARAPAA